MQRAAQHESTTTDTVADGAGSLPSLLVFFLYFFVVFLRTAGGWIREGVLNLLPFYFLLLRFHRIFGTYAFDKPCLSL